MTMVQSTMIVLLEVRFFLLDLVITTEEWALLKELHDESHARWNLTRIQRVVLEWSRVHLTNYCDSLYTPTHCVMKERSNLTLWNNSSLGQIVD